MHKLYNPKNFYLSGPSFILVLENSLVILARSSYQQYLSLKY